MVNQEDLRRICQIVNKRNELQKERCSAKSKARYYRQIQHSLRNVKRKKQAEKLLNPKQNKLAKFHDDYVRLCASHHSKSYDVPHNVANAIRQLQSVVVDEFQRQKQSAELQLANIGLINHPKKYDKIPLHKVDTLAQKYVAMEEMAKYKIMQHTEETTKELRRLYKKNNMRQSNAANGSVDTIHVGYYGEEGYKYFNKEQIKSIAMDVSIEEVLSE